MAKKAKKSSKKSKKKQDQGFFVRFIKFSFKWGFVLGIWATIFLTALLLYFSAELSSITKDMVFERRPTIIIKAANGDIVDRYGDIKGEIIDVTDLPPHVTNAVLAIEDRRFYNHYGVDPMGIARAFVVNVQKGGFVQGGSTITQQLAKNLFLTRERTLKRKIQEVILALRLESELTKDEILSAYLNRVYLGSGAYGIDAAAQTYFKKPAKDLTVKEAATIAGLLKAPSRYSPNASPTLANQRMKTVLRAMADAGYIDEDEYNLSKNDSPIPRRKPSSSDSIRYYTDYVVNQIEDLIGPVDQDIIVETTLNVAIQQELEESITKKLLAIKEARKVDQAAGMVMRLDGAVMAIMGGGDYDVSEYNRVTESLRPPGSSFKPIVYLTAIENGWDMYSLIEDEPRNYGSYRPRNFGNKYYGPVTLYEALTLSLNTVAVALMKDVGPPTAIQTARRLGITADLESSLSTALGSNGVPMIQMITAYATIGRGGSAIDPYAITAIRDNNNVTLYERTKPQETRQVVDREHAAQINHMMQSVIQNGTGQGASLPYPAAGKTGTSQEYRDAWFIGYPDKYVGAIWFGNDDNSPTKALTGGSAPAQVWREVMLRAQAQGGRSYASFYNLSEDRFDTLLGRILNDLEFNEMTLENISRGNWLGNIFNDREEEIRDRRFDPQTGQVISNGRYSGNWRQDQYRRPDRNDQTQGGYNYNVND